MLGLVLAGVLVAAGCSNRSDSADTTAAPPPVTDAPTTTTPGSTEPPGTETTAPPATDAPGITFGDLASPCGPGDATIAEGQNGGDTLRIATGTDKGAEVAPGLNAEMYDAAVAFAEWCNEQGGIAGLPIEVIDGDAKLFEVPAAMERICDQAFAMVGGGWAFDDLQFPRFHECGMIDIAGYAVTTAKAMSNGMVQVIPNPSNEKPGQWFMWARDNYPEAITRTATVFSDILTTQIVEQQYREVMDAVGGFTVVDQIPYNPAGEANWAPIAQRLKENDVRFLSFVGVPEVFAQLLRSMEEVGYEPELILLDGGFYADVLIERAGSAAEGAITRTVYRPFEEADQSKAISDYLAMMETYNPEGKIAGLGLQATSAYLLFATAANRCIEANDGVLDRECVLAEASAVTDWTAGGLHTPTSPGTNEPPFCTTLLQVQDGTWTRLYPELGSADDDGNGFSCDPESNVELTGDYGDVNAGVDPNR